MGASQSTADSLPDRLTPASEGVGPLFQRDYWAVLDGCGLSAPEVAAFVRERFVDLPPKALVTFRCPEGAERPLAVGDALAIHIRAVCNTGVRVIHVDDHSVTLGTLEGHPEAGRITFGAYPNEHGDVIFHIRSRARARSRKHLTGWLAAGEPMQTNTWTDFVDRLAHTVGNGVVGAIHAETQEVEEEDADRAMDRPTFISQEAANG